MVFSHATTFFCNYCPTTVVVTYLYQNLPVLLIFFVKFSFQFSFFFNAFLLCTKSFNSFNFCFFAKTACHFFFNSSPVFCIFVSVIYGTCCTIVIWYNTLIYEDGIFTSLCRLLFYTILYCNKANSNHHKMAYNGLIWWHDKLLFHQNQGGWWDK